MFNTGRCNCPRQVTSVCELAKACVEIAHQHNWSQFLLAQHVSLHDRHIIRQGPRVLGDMVRHIHKTNMHISCNHPPQTNICMEAPEKTISHDPFGYQNNSARARGIAWCCEVMHNVGAGEGSLYSFVIPGIPNAHYVSICQQFGTCCLAIKAYCMQSTCSQTIRIP